MAPRFRSQQELIRFVGSQSREDPVVWILGSGLTTPAKHNGSLEPHGIPGTETMINRVREVISTENKERLEDFDAALARAGSEPAARYQTAFATATEILVDDGILDRVVRRAVLEACSVTDRGVRRQLEAGEHGTCLQVIRDTERWSLRPGLEHFGHIARISPQFLGQTVLTTNFDPLIEVSLFRGSGSPVTTVMDGDGALGHTQTEQAHVVHLHGYWFGAQCLHTQTQLEKPRPKLQGSLHQLLGSSDICVLGYGGWDDVLMRSVEQVVSANVAARGRVHWCFFEANEDDVLRRYKGLLERFEDAEYDRRFFGYSGIDADIFFPALHERLGREPKDSATVTFFLERRLDTFENEKRELEEEIKKLKQAQMVIESIQTISDLKADLAKVGDNLDRFLGTLQELRVETRNDIRKSSKRIVRGLIILGIILATGIAVGWLL